MLITYSPVAIVFIVKSLLDIIKDTINLLFYLYYAAYFLIQSIVYLAIDREMDYLDAINYSVTLFGDVYLGYMTLGGKMGIDGVEGLYDWADDDVSELYSKLKLYNDGRKYRIEIREENED